MRKILNKRSKDKIKAIHKKVLNKRTFLNLKEGPAISEVEVYRSLYLNKTKKSMSIHSSGEFTLGDCSQLVTLHFDLSERKNTLHKIRKLEMMVSKLKSAIMNEFVVIDGYKKQYSIKKGFV